MSPLISVNADGRGLVWRALFVSIVTLSCLVSAVWAVRVPFLQEPDESAHFDYAVSIATARHLLYARGKILRTDVHPYTRYLEKVSNFWPMRYARDARVPAGYGTAEYYRRVDELAPDAGRFDVSAGSTVPYIVAFYPVGFYAFEAVVIDVTAALTHNSIVEMFFAARLACVLLLAVFLIFSDLILRELRVGRWRRLALLATIGFFPLTSWVFGYVQPDDLVATLLALTLYLALVQRRSNRGYTLWLLLGISLALLLATKVQYFLAAAIPVIASLMVFSQSTGLNGAQLARRWVSILLPSVVAGLSCRWLAAAPKVTGPLGGGSFSLFAAWHARHGALMRYVLENVAYFYQSYFGFGQGLVSYWGSFSWTLTRIVIGPWSLYVAVYVLVIALTTAFVFLIAIRQSGTCLRIARVWRTRKALAALRLLCSDVLLNSYVVILILLSGVSILTNGTAVNQGRYFLPYVLVTVMCATRYGPAVLPKRTSLAVANSMLALLLGYSCAGVYYGLRALDQRFYATAHVLYPYEEWVKVDSQYNCEADVFGESQKTVLFADRDEPLRICGWAIDSRFGGDAKGVLVSVDGGKPYAARYGLHRPDAVLTVLDDGVYASGFEAIVPTADLASGLHSIRLAVLEHDRARAYPSPQTLLFRLR